MAGHGYAFIVYDTEQNAKGAAEMAKNTPSPDFVKFDRIDVQEIVAST